MPEADEITAKLTRIRACLSRTGCSSAVFGTPGSFAWITGGGRSHVSVAGDAGVGLVVVTPDDAHLLASNIELARLREEERAGDFVPHVHDWWSGDAATTVAVLGGTKVVSDVPGLGAMFSPEELMGLRNPLLPEEVDRYRLLGEDVGIVLTHAVFHCRPGLTERQLAGLIAGTAVDLGIDPLVTLCAVDERIAERRHPLPTDRRLDRCALLVLTGRRHGLHVSASRMVHFGPIPVELERRHHACAGVDAVFLSATQPGTRLQEIFRLGQEAYAAAGFADEWKHHHQGGPTGYAARDLKVTPQSDGAVSEGQAFAWNPTIAGTKCEDTVLVTGAGIEVLSLTPDLPSVEVEAAGRLWERPAILER